MSFHEKKPRFGKAARKSRLRKLGGLAAVLLCSAMLADPAGAQEDLADTNGDKPYALDSITVTAQKREEDVQKIPMSVAVFPETELEEAGIQNTVELQRYIPNVFVKDSGSYQQTTIRGVGSFVTSLYSGTAMYIDDISVPTVFMQNQDLFDVARVEVLKGPQGTLYGRNSEAGVINIVTRQPDNTPRGRLFGEFSMYDTNHGGAPGYQVGGSASGPLVKDKLFINLAGKWNYDLGAIRNEYSKRDDANEIKRITGRGQLRWTPTDRLDISLLADAANSHDKFGYGHYIDGPFKTDFHKISRNDDDNRHWRGNSQSLRAKYKGDEVDFLSVTGRRYFGDDSKWDMDSTSVPLPYMNATLKEHDYLWSQEFRLSSSDKNKSPFSWLAGLYGFTEQLNVNGGSKSGMADPYYGTGMLLAGKENRETDINMGGFAVFGEGTYTLFERLHLTAGLRYDYMDQWGSQDYTMDATFGGMPMMADKKSYKKRIVGAELLPKFSVGFDVTENVLAYATVSKGYLAGGYNYGSATSKSTLTYDPEYTWSYEVGFKTSWLDKRLIANVAAFYIDMQNKQASEVVSQGVTKISNADRANSKGFEAELRARPLEGLDLFGGFGYTETEITTWRDRVDNYNYSGNELPNVPKYTYNIGGMYQHSSGVYGRVDVLGTGPFYHDAKNDTKEPGYELVNLRLGYLEGDFDVSVWCKNAFDRKYRTVRQSIAGYGTLAFDGDPRQFGITVAYSF